jgi:hypothetical protein
MARIGRRRAVPSEFVQPLVGFWQKLFRPTHHSPGDPRLLVAVHDERLIGVERDRLGNFDAGMHDGIHPDGPRCCTTTPSRNFMTRYCVGPATNAFSKSTRPRKRKRRVGPTTISRRPWTSHIANTLAVRHGVNAERDFSCFRFRIVSDRSRRKVARMGGGFSHRMSGQKQRTGCDRNMAATSLARKDIWQIQRCGFERRAPRGHFA